MLGTATTFADRLRDLMARKGVTSQGKLARRAGLTPQAVSKLVKGRSEPNWETVQRLAAALGVGVEAFAVTEAEVGRSELLGNEIG